MNETQSELDDERPEPRSPGIGAWLRRTWKQLLGRPTEEVRAGMTTNTERIAKLLGITTRQAIELCGELQAHAKGIEPSFYDLAEVIAQQVRSLRATGQPVTVAGVKSRLVSRYAEVVAAAEIQHANPTAAPAETARRLGNTPAGSQKLPPTLTSSARPITAPPPLASDSISTKVPSRGSTPVPQPPAKNPGTALPANPKAPQKKQTLASPEPSLLNTIPEKLRDEVEKMVCWPDIYLPMRIIRTIIEELGCSHETAVQIMNEVSASQSGLVSHYWSNSPKPPSSASPGVHSVIPTGSVVGPVKPTAAGDDLGPDPDNPESCRAYSMMSGDTPCLFVTGKAGTGKSYLLRYFVEHSGKRVVVVAPSGIAAVNAGGQTIHSFFRFPLRPINDDDVVVVRESAERELYRMLDTIVIDEVSMLNANQLDSIDRFMRLNGRDRDLPFGGAQLVLFGDLFQLPPIVSDKAEQEFFAHHYQGSPFFFSAHVIRKTGLPVIELQQNYRQQDREFIELLNAVRMNELTTPHQRLLNQRYQPQFEPPEGNLYVTLTTRNERVDDINRRRLAKLMLPEYGYTADVEGEFVMNARPTDTLLKLRRGAQVIFIRNDMSRRWVNGTIGQVADLGPDFIDVDIKDNGHSNRYRIERETWPKLKYKFDANTGRITTEEVARFTQYPLRLAWALTIHKAQGQTLERVIIDLTGGAFAPGQVYVALSRCRTLEGIVLHTPVWRNDVLLSNSHVLEFARRYLT